MSEPSDSTPKPSGRQLLEAEMARQHADARRSLADNEALLARLHAAILAEGRLLLVGMGASHYANRTAETAWRRLGVEAWACTAAELLQTPALAAHGVVLTVSQSGESGEIVELMRLGHLPAGRSFGMTLDGASSLARALPSLVAAGGGEIAFAATRSLLLTVALHAALLDPKAAGRLDALLAAPSAPDTGAALAALSGKASVVVSGAAELRGLAEANALMLMELGRLPALGFESGQFRHGPLELLGPGVGVVLLRGPGDLDGGTAGLARTVREAGGLPVVVDCSGAPAIEGAITLAFPRLGGLAAILAMMPALQRLIVDFTAQRVERVGEPVRSTKITGLDHG